MKENNPEIRYLVVEGIVVNFGSEADMANNAIEYDSDYELLTKEELSPEQTKDAEALEDERLAE